MEPSEYLAALRKRWIVIVAAGIVGAGFMGASAARTPDTYRSTAKVFVAVQIGTTPGDLVQGSTYAQSQVQSYAQLAKEPIVLDQVVERLGLETNARALAGRVRTENPLNTLIIEISVTDGVPQQAADVANAVAEELPHAVNQLSGGQDRDSVNVETISDARVPTFPVAPNVRRDAVTGLLAGLALGAVLAILRELTDTRVRGRRDLGRATDAPVLGSARKEPAGPAGRAYVQGSPTSVIAESYRRFQTNLKFLFPDDDPKVIVVTSGLPAEGKSTTALNLALALAEGSSRVLLIDADLRRPSIASSMGLEGQAGLTTVLIGQAALDDVVQPWAGGALHVLTSGEVPPNPTALLDSERMEALLAHARTRYDVVIVDSAPVLPFADTTILARLADGAVVVVDCRRTRRGDLAETIDTLQAVSADVLGVFLNKLPDKNVELGNGYAEVTRRRRGHARRARPAPEPPADPAAEPRASVRGGLRRRRRATVVPEERPVFEPGAESFDDVVLRPYQGRNGD